MNSGVHCRTASLTTKSYTLQCLRVRLICLNENNRNKIQQQPNTQHSVFSLLFERSLTEIYNLISYVRLRSRQTLSTPTIHSLLLSFLFYFYDYTMHIRQHCYTFDEEHKIGSSNFFFVLFLCYRTRKFTLYVCTHWNLCMVFQSRCVVL